MSEALIMWLCLATAATGGPRTVYHDRIDGLLMPTLTTPESRKLAASLRKQK